VLEWVVEDNLLFKLSQFEEPLRQWISQEPSPVSPPTRAAQVLQDLKDLKDLSVTRDASRVKWGIPCPSDAKQTIYVWLDALVNYLTSAGYPDKSVCTQPTNQPNQPNQLASNQERLREREIGRDFERFMD
jgi:methionyl-tRNA synthetase